MPALRSASDVGIKRRTYVRLLWPLALVLGVVVWRGNESRRVVSATAKRIAADPVLRITILGNPSDPRVAPAREALAHWNSEFARLGRRVRLDSASVRNDSVPDDTLRAASEAAPWNGPATRRLVTRLVNVPGDIVIVLSHTDLVSFGLAWRAGSRGVVVVRRPDIWPLSLPNTIRNVVAHELGHSLGLGHNADTTSLMCGRPASCRPIIFASDSARFFPLTPAEELSLRTRWP